MDIVASEYCMSGMKDQLYGTQHAYRVVVI